MGTWGLGAMRQTPHCTVAKARHAPCALHCRTQLFCCWLVLGWGHGPERGVSLPVCGRELHTTGCGTSG